MTIIFSESHVVWRKFTLYRINPRYEGDMYYQYNDGFTRCTLFNDAGYKGSGLWVARLEHQNVTVTSCGMDSPEVAFLNLESKIRGMILFLEQV